MSLLPRLYREIVKTKKLKVHFKVLYIEKIENTYSADKM